LKTDRKLPRSVESNTESRSARLKGDPSTENPPPNTPEEEADKVPPTRNVPYANKLVPILATESVEIKLPSRTAEREDRLLPRQVPANTEQSQHARVEAVTDGNDAKTALSRTVIAPPRLADPRVDRQLPNLDVARVDNELPPQKVLTTEQGTSEQSRVE
jgi:hypothetical protein